jgi:hypothetical protein
MEKRIARFDQNQNQEFAELLKLKIPSDQKFDMASHSKLVQNQAGPTPNDSFPYSYYFLKLFNNDFVLLVKLLSASQSQYVGVLLPFTVRKQVDPIFLPDVLADNCYQYCEWAQKGLDDKAFAH